MSPTTHATAVTFVCGFLAGAFVVNTLSNKKEKVRKEKAKTPVSDRSAWLKIFQARLMATWAAAMTLDEEKQAEELFDIGQEYFGPERWTIGHHLYKDPEL